MSLLAAWSFVPSGVDPMLFLVVGSLSVLLMGAAKSGFGGTAGMLAVPLMVLACNHNAKLATGIMLPILIVCDYASVIIWWRQWELRNIRLLVPGLLLGVGAGWAALKWMFNSGQDLSGKELASDYLSLAIGLVAVGFVGLRVVRWIRKDIRVFKPGVVDGLIAGSSAGFVSTLAHTAGPITNMYMLPQGMDKGTFQATTVLYYWIGNQVKLLPYICLGLLSGGSLGADLTLMPALLGGVALGVFLHKKVNEKLFSDVIYVLLGLIGPYLIITASLKIWG